MVQLVRNGSVSSGANVCSLNPNTTKPPPWLASAAMSRASSARSSAWSRLRQLLYSISSVRQGASIRSWIAPGAAASKTVSSGPNDRASSGKGSLAGSGGARASDMGRTIRKCNCRCSKARGPNARKYICELKVLADCGAQVSVLRKSLIIRTGMYKFPDKSQGIWNSRDQASAAMPARPGQVARKVGGRAVRTLPPFAVMPLRPTAR